MTFICYIETTASTVPHMVPLNASKLDEALDEAREAMNLYSSAIAAHVFQDEQRIETLTPKRGGI